MTSEQIMAAVQSPNWCCEGVTRRGEFQPCDKPAVALRMDPEEREPYPVCAFHARGHMVSLSSLVVAVRVCGVSS